jgi:OmpA family
MSVPPFAKGKFLKTLGTLVAGVLLASAISPVQAATKTKVGSLGSVHFAGGSSELTAEAKRTLTSWTAQLAKADKVQVTGYVEVSGNAAHGLSVSSARAISVMRYLKASGVRATILTRGAGVPSQGGHSVSARRAEVVILSLKPTPKPTPSATPTPTPTNTCMPMPTLRTRGFVSGHRGYVLIPCSTPTPTPTPSNPFPV